MYLMFVDESGTPPQKGSEKSEAEFLLHGLIIKMQDWHDVAKQFYYIKNKYQVQTEIKWRYFSPHKNNYGLSYEQQENMRAEFFNLISSPEIFTSISVLCNSKKIYTKSYIKNSEDVYEYCYKTLQERFQYFLQEKSSHGLIICDCRDNKSDSKLRSKHLNLLNNPNSTSSNLYRIVESIMFTPSETSVGIQLSDLVAGAILRNFKQKESPYFQKVYPIIRKSKDNKVEGFGIAVFPI